MYRSSRIALAVIAISLFSFAISPVLAAPPSPLRLDTGFGNQGLVTDQQAPPGFEVVQAMTVAPGRSIYVAAQSHRGPFGSPAPPGTVVIARYWRDGELERTFGVGGYLTLPGLGAINALAADNSGRLLVLSNRTTISRIAGGGLDPSFGIGGSVSMASLGPGSFELSSLAPLPGGGVAAAGVAGSAAQMAVVKLRSDGSLDASFNGTGFRVVRFGPDVYGGVTSGAYQVKAQSDGKLVLAGYAKYRPALARLLPNGRLDPTFGRDGRVRSPHRLRGKITALAIRHDGSILAGANGSTSYPGWNRAMLLRYGPTGALDRRFGGIAVPDGRSDPHVIPVALMRARRHIFLVTRGGGPSIRAYRLNGKPLDLGQVPGNPRALYKAIAAAPQDRKLVVAWTSWESLPQGGEVDLSRFIVR